MKQNLLIKITEISTLRNALRKNFELFTGRLKPQKFLDLEILKKKTGRLESQKFIGLEML